MNDRDYRLGHTLQGSLWVQLAPTEWLKPKLSLSTHIWGRIIGEDREIRGPLDFFPAPVADPSLYGGEKLILSGGLEASWPRALVQRLNRTGFPGRLIGAQDGDDAPPTARTMEVSEAKRIVDRLIYVGGGEALRADLELNTGDAVTDQKHRVNSAAKSQQR